MVKRKPKSTSNKRRLKITHSCFGSPLLLYGILAAVLLNLFQLLNTDDNESVFLFIIISAVIYTHTENMIFVLGGAFISVNLMILLRTCFNNDIHEGFEEEAPTSIELQKYLVKTYTEDDKYLQYTNDIDGEGNIANLISNVLDNPLFDDSGELLDENTFDETPVKALMTFLDTIQNKHKDDATQNSEILFIMKLYENLF